MKYFLVDLVAVLLLTGCTAHELPKKQLIVVGEKVEESDLLIATTEAPVVTELPVATEEPAGAPMVTVTHQVTESPRVPVNTVEMGYMSNPDEDCLMANEGYRDKIVQGITNVIDV